MKNTMGMRTLQDLHKYKWYKYNNGIKITTLTHLTTNRTFFKLCTKLLTNAINKIYTIYTHRLDLAPYYEAHMCIYIISSNIQMPPIILAGLCTVFEKEPRLFLLKFLV